MRNSHAPVWFLMLTLFLVGCYTTGTIKAYPVQIISEPAGAVVEVNDNYVGKAPLTVELEGWGETRTFARDHTIVAHPLQDGGYTQVKIFSGWLEPSQTFGDSIPETIYFNMSLIPSPDTHEININK